MSKIHVLRVFLNERLTAAAEEIFGVVEKTVVEYQREVVRLQSLLDNVLKPQIKTEREDVQQLTLFASEAEQQLHSEQEWSPSHEQEDPEPTLFKKELEELWTSQEDQQLNNDSNPAFVKGDYYGEQTEPSHLYQAQKEGNGERNSFPRTTSEQIKTEPDGQDYRESEPTSVSQPPSVNLECSAGQSESAVSRESDTLPSYFKPFNSLRTKLIKGQSLCINSKGWKSTQLSFCKSPSQSHDSLCCCKVCGKSFHYMGSLFKHMQTHTKDKKGICGACGKCFPSTESMNDHLQTHFAARFGCNFCGKFFTRNGTLKTHMRIHTGEKPYRCSYCCKGFISGGDLKNHVRIHTGEKPFCCPDCGKSFTRSGHLKGHMRTHIVDK